MESYCAGRKVEREKKWTVSRKQLEYMDRITEILERVSKIKDKSLEELFKTSLKKYLLCKNEDEKRASYLKKWRYSGKRSMEWSKSKI